MTPYDQPPPLPDPPDEVIDLVPDESGDLVPMVQPYRRRPVRRARRVPPGPDLLRAVLWCGALLVALYLPMLLAGGLTFVGMAVASGDAMGYWQAERQQMQDALEHIDAADAPPGEPTPIPTGVSYSLAVGMAAGHVGSLTLTLLLLRFVTGRDWPRQVALRRPALVPLLLSLVLLPGLMIAHTAIHAGLQETAEAALRSIRPGADAGSSTMDGQLRALLSPWPLGLAVLLIGVGPGVIEELFCRGFLGRGLMARYGVAGGVVITSILFGMLHIAPLYAVGTMVMGVFLHLTYLATRSLWVPVLLHFLNNTISVLTVLEVPTLPGLAADPTTLPAVVYLLGFALAAAGLWALWSGRARLVSTDPDQPAWQPAYPGVELPPEGSGTVVRHPRPNLAAVALALAALAGLIYSLT